MSKKSYFLGFTPSCTKDYLSINILNVSPDEQSAKEVLADLTQTQVDHLFQFLLKECAMCKENGISDEHDSPCINGELNMVTYPHNIYSIALTHKQYENAGLDLSHNKCGINLPRFWIIEVPGGTQRGIVKNQLQNSIC